MIGNATKITIIIVVGILNNSSIRNKEIRKRGYVKRSIENKTES